MNESYFIGWDVGGWSCDKKQNSQDAIVILNASAKRIGCPWRGNLRNTINKSKSSIEFVEKLFALCKAPYNTETPVTLAIDAPLGYSAEFIALITNPNTANQVGNIGCYAKNPYLLRKTERFLISHVENCKPLSAVAHAIGSQSTKGIHVLRKFEMKLEGVGVWKKDNLTVIETYPTVNRAAFKLLDQSQNENDDIIDACICARVAHAFSKSHELFHAPDEKVPQEEGWIWALKKGFNA